ncbi:FAD-dependent monooxygenase [Arthrobacter sp. P2b]|uniref:FAD-dependent monooxygenase n=1 Tax=Arthrobacter sp. P2b TaxID=1938741 RepID=UPI0009A58646|nr:FAD-dependent monooxygenase [Arthrobacter sp. P2b]SLK14689.1 anthraniloyl-CoA monooxygenase [Arthrobacter sp. P2b]
MKVTIIGGGPGGLYLASLLGERVPSAEVTLYERNPLGATYGFGVVFSEPTMQNLKNNDPAGFEELFASAAKWPGIDIKIRNEVWRCDGNGFSAIERRRLLNVLHERADRAGTDMHYETLITPESPELADADIVVVADGGNSMWRTQQAADLGATVETASAKFIWFGTTKVFDEMTFLFEKNEHGWFAVHAYPYNNEASTFVVETDEATWRRAGLDAFDTTQPPGASDEATAAYVEKLFAKHLDGGRMILNNSRWANFRTVRTRDWRVDSKTVLLGDAAHTAHFSVGSGTKMAMEDALCLAERIAAVVAGDQDVDTALSSYEDERRQDVRRIQDLARPSLSWWEHFGEYAEMPPAQFTFHFLTRSGRLGRRRLERSDPEFVKRSLGALLGSATAPILNTEYKANSELSFSSRILGLTPQTTPVGPGSDSIDAQLESAIPDLHGRVRPGTQREIAIFAGRGSGIWCCAPAHPDQTEEFVKESIGSFGADPLVIVEAASVDDGDIRAAADAAVAQQRVAEILRIRHGFVVALVLRDCTADVAASLIISGRTDLVAVPVTQVKEILDEELAIHA